MVTIIDYLSPRAIIDLLRLSNTKGIVVLCCPGLN
jgi:hypothetical protein